MELHPIMWKQIVGEPLDPDYDLKTSDKFMHQLFASWRENAKAAASEEEFQEMCGFPNFTINTGLGDSELVPGGYNIMVTRENLDEYIKMASLKLLHKADTQMKHFLSGVHYVLPKEGLQMLSWRNAEVRAMGIPTVDIDLLRRHTSYGVVSNKFTVSWKAAMMITLI